MWNDKKLYRLFFLTALLTGSILTNTSQAETLRVCYDQWAPMTMFPTSESPERGVVIDMLEQIYTAKGYTLEY